MGYNALLTDKDGGYALVPTNLLPSIDETILKQQIYQEISPLEVRWDLVEPLWMAATRDITKNDERITRAQLTASMFTGATWVAKLQKTVKTHKNQGQVSCRGIHATAPYSFASVGRWVAAVLRGGMQKYQHIMTCTNDLIEKIKTIKVTSKTWMIKLDFKDLFLTGSMEENIAAALHHCPKNLHTAMNSALLLLLSTQYVKSPHFPDRVWKTVLGSGMGLPHSGEVAESLLATRECECLLDDDFRNKYSILAYLRYRDDGVLLIDDNGDGNVAFCYRTMFDILMPFVVQVEEISQHTVNTLDLTLTINQTTGCIEYQPFIKPTALKVLLNPSSYHTKAVHKAWPLAETFRIQRLSCSNAHYHQAVFQFIELLEKHDVHSNVISTIKSCYLHSKQQWCRGTYQLLHAQWLQKQSRKQQTELWMPLPYHHVWAEGGVQKCIDDFNRDAYNRMLLESAGTAYRVNCSWKMLSQPIKNLLVRQ